MSSAVNESAVEVARVRAQNIARRVLQHGYDPLLACRELASLTGSLPDLPREIRSIFEAIASEVDDLPLGRERVNWSLPALSAQDPQSDDYREQVRDVVRAALQSLLLALEPPNTRCDRNEPLG